MKLFSVLRTTLNEHGPVERGPHLFTPGYSPPNILILKRKTVRAYSSTERVALYYNEKLQRYFSVPFTVGRDDARDDVVGVSEDRFSPSGYASAASSVWRASHKKKANTTNSTTNTIKEEVVLEDAISHLKKVKEFHTNTPLYHKDGTQTQVDPTTAHALLTVHDALHPDNQKKMSDALAHSQAKFHKVLNFAWKQVK